MSEKGDSVEPGPEDNTQSLEQDPDAEVVEIVEGPFAVLAKTLDFLDVAWDHAVVKDDFSKMMVVVDKTLDVNDRYMAVQFTQEESNERIERSPERFGFSTEINHGECPPDLKSR